VHKTDGKKAFSSPFFGIFSDYSSEDLFTGKWILGWAFC